MTLDDYDGLLNWERLQPWIDSHDLPGSGPVTAVTQLTGGSQNNLFLMERKGGSFVLRRPPRHLRANSNDTMLREARVLAALTGSGVPHPAFHGACDDESVIGASFYVMEPIDGFNPTGGLQGRYATDPEWRREMAFELVGGAAKLGTIEPDKVGLSDFGKPDQWLERQVGRWRSQLDGYSQMDGYDGPEIPHVNEVADWLEAERPDQCRIGIIHGDLQWANVMFANDQPRLAALIDWELSTLGDPLLDLGWILTSWIEDGDPPGHHAQVEPYDDFPSRAEIIDHYLSLSGRDANLVPWFFVLACYKLGILLEGTYARSLAGKAPRDIGDMLHGQTLWYFAKANQLITGAA
jgi:aminoglycoside phosphotransferase (APT) family kinase protein